MEPAAVHEVDLPEPKFRGSPDQGVLGAGLWRQWAGDFPRPPNSGTILAPTWSQLPKLGKARQSRNQLAINTQ